MVDEKTKKPTFFDTLLDTSEKLLSAWPIKSLVSKWEELFDKAKNVVTNIDMQELSDRGRKALDKTADMVSDFDAEEFLKKSKVTATMIKDNPQKSLDTGIEKVVGWIAGVAGMPDPKTGKQDSGDAIASDLVTKESKSEENASKEAASDEIKEED